MKKDAFLKSKLWQICLFQFLVIPFPSFAQKYWVRQNERDNERWSMSTYFTEKNKLKYSDFLLRFYSDGKGKNTPRLEPFVYGLWYNGLTSDGSLWEGVGYGGSIYFNNFVSGILKIPTPNIVPGVFGEHREEVARGVSRFDTYGPTLRFFGRNQQDSALFLNLKKTERDLLGKYYEEWNWEAGAVVYLAQSIRAEGTWLFSNDDWQAFPSSYAQQSGFRFGGGIEVGFLRVSGYFEKISYTMKNPAPNTLRSFDEIRRIIQVGISI